MAMTLQEKVHLGLADKNELTICCNCLSYKVMPGTSLGVEPVCQHADTRERIDLVTGEERMQTCRAVNTDGQCGQYQAKEPQGVPA